MIKFIVIDDEPYVIDLFSSILDWENYDFEYCGGFLSWGDASEWLSANKCNVIFTDIVMPDISGLEVARECHEKFPHILIIVFSAHRNFDYAVDAIKYNVFDYLIKPLSYNKLIETILRIKGAVKLYGLSSDSIVEDIGDDVIGTAKAFISEHYSEDISISDVAEHVCLCSGYFSTLFKKKTGVNYISYLKKYRLEKSKILLADRKIKLSVIPREIGIKSYSYFTKLFQEAYELTPTEYRNKILNNNRN